MTELERAIVATVARAKAANLEPKSLYLVPADFAEVERLGHADVIAGLAIKRSAGRGRSKLYCRHGISVALSARPLPPLRPYLRAASSSAPGTQRGRK